MTDPLSHRAEHMAFWAQARREVPSLPAEIAADIWFFGDSPELAASLAELVLTGPKRATAGLLAEMQAQGVTLPAVGGYSLVTDYHGAPLMILRSTQVDIQPFETVDADFAAAEGEGDGSLRYWQDAHESYFKRSCARIGIDWRPDLDVICERFELVFPRRR
ncbi:ASCH domain-containing protein [Dongia rigui]|uniref:ASCH domain-containing protein n=1 Tax=Dongia rigui TaxID=940149 RepID=A0ABU5DYS9_9PROT|nr:ASCH domain-containing protein [Dongia rigui]MDY0872441.1 ASCH domain-containing protein [Dongia rigui]